MKGMSPDTEPTGQTMPAASAGILDRQTLAEQLLLLEDYLRYGCRSGRIILPLPGEPASCEPVSAEEALAELEAQVRSCTACPLSQSRNRTVFGQGPANPLVLVIGEGPGAEEDRQGLPFVGASGQLLDRMLAAISLSRDSNCYIANIVKCRPPNNREPTPAERSACIGYLRRQIELLRPQFILCVGRTAAHGLLDLSDPISRIRGRTYQFEGIPVVVTFHPSALLRDASLKRPAWEDLKRFRALIDQAQHSSAPADAPAGAPAEAPAGAPGTGDSHD